MKEYASAFDRIAALVRRAGELPPDDLIRAHIAQHICVLVSGILEKTCARLLILHVKRTSAPRSARYAGQSLRRLQNLNAPKIEELLDSFDPSWKEELKTFWSGQIRDAVDSIVNNRHQISHGQQVGVSLVQADKWAKDARSFCDKLHEITIR